MPSMRWSESRDNFRSWWADKTVSVAEVIQDLEAVLSSTVAHRGYRGTIIQLSIVAAREFVEHRSTGFERYY
jgi:hypothetical protein